MTGTAVTVLVVEAVFVDTFVAIEPVNSTHPTEDGYNAGLNCTSLDPGLMLATTF